ncbi:aspartate/glutamate racemase family protein [Myroides marinus]|uniref:aspartate/glutamate racemase family protein n=1 Tax=Myroides marinus TaxID=703342 RepID=UPI000741E311|nr:amino acid racemase [Myroides marinus]KUF44224.1 aspartate racemase [Myroides marinus]MDM1374861.1 amino acid racemase [Myroides marinus]
MKRIGILGGTAYPSTALYYTLLNKMANEKWGGYHSCPIILYSIDYHHIKSRYANQWDEIPNILKDEVENLLMLQPDCFLIANNTLHKAYDQIKHEFLTNIPMSHSIELTKSHILKNNMKKVLLLGTPFTMEDDYFKSPLQQAGIEVIIPNQEEIAKIGAFQSTLATGSITDEMKAFFIQLMEDYNSVDGVILGCTELPLVFNSLDTNLPIIDTMVLQCEDAFSKIQ